jgi:hypothetical protein
MGEYLRECGRRAKERGVLWIASEEEREAIGAEVRARLAREAEEGLCVGEEAGEGYVATEGGSTKGQKGEKGAGKTDFSDDSLKRTRLVNEVTA